MNAFGCRLPSWPPVVAKCCWSLIFSALFVTCIYAAPSGNPDYEERSAYRPSTELADPSPTTSPTSFTKSSDRKNGSVGPTAVTGNVQPVLTVNVSTAITKQISQGVTHQRTSSHSVSSTTLPTMSKMHQSSPAARPTRPTLTGASSSVTASAVANKVFVTAAPPNLTCHDIFYPIEGDSDGATIYFRKSSPGIPSQGPCPNNKRKLAIWKCTSMGWSSEPGQPDLTDCVNETLGAELDQLITSINQNGIAHDHKVVEEAITTFEGITGSSDRRKSFLAGDLLKVARTASQLADKVPEMSKGSNSTTQTAASMMRSCSNMMGADTHKAWQGLPKKDRGTVLGSIFENNEKLSFAALPVEETRSLFNLAGDDSDTTTTTSKDTGLRIQLNKAVTTSHFDVTLAQVVRDSRLAFSEAVKTTNDAEQVISIDFPASLIQRVRSKKTLSLASLVTYKSLSSDVEQLKIGLDPQKKQFNSPIFSVSLADENGDYLKDLKLPEYFTFAIEHTYPNSDAFETSCVYYDINYSLWLERGCERVSVSSTHTVCKCDHLTTFAILIDFTGRSRPIDSINVEGNITSGGNVTQTVAEKAMINISIIGCALSIAALFIFVLIVLFVSRQNTTLRVIYSNFGLCLLIAEVIFLAGADKVNTNGCVPVAVLLQFFFTSTFLWSGALAFYFVLVIFGAEPLTSRDQGARWPYFFFGCYFVAAMLIGATWITSTASGETAYGNKNYCWMNLPYTWFFISPIAFILVFNFGVLSAIFFKTCSSRLTSTNYVAQGNGESTLRIVCRAMVGLVWTMLVLCATWVIGFFYVSSQSQAVEFVFVILNSFQGVLVLVFYLVTNKQIRLDFAMFCKRKTWLPQSIRDWASYKISSSNSNGSHQDGRSSSQRKSNLSQYSREMSNVINS